MRGDKIYIVRSGRLFKVVNRNDVEDMIRVVQNPSSLSNEAYGFYYDCVHGVSDEERASLRKIVDQNPNYDGQKQRSVRSAVRQRVNDGDVVLHKPGYKVGRNQYLCRDVDRKRMLKRVKEAGLMARPAAGVGYDYNFKGYIYTVDWRK